MEPMTPSRRMTAERAHADLLREGALDREVSVERRRMPQSWLRGIFAVSFLVGAGSCAGAVMGTEAILVLWPVSVIVMLASAMALSSERAARWRPGKLVALPTGGVGVLGAKDAHVRAEEVIAGWIEEPHRAMVETRRGDVVGVACASPEEARVPAMDHGDRGRHAGEEQGFLHGGVTAAHHDHVLVLEEEPVTGGARAHPVAAEP